MKYQRVLMIGVLLAILAINSCDDDDDNDNDGSAINLGLVAEGFTSPLLLIESPDNSGRLFIIEQLGQIYIVKNGQKVAQPFLDISSKLVQLQTDGDERGLLGLAFHPEYATNGRFFVFYSGPLRSGGPSGFNHTNYVSEFKVSGNADVADPGSERILLAIDHPQGNHNAGMIAFGMDNYLYISVGDGGGGNDNGTGHVSDWYADNGGGNGQDITQNLLGNILRIDVTPTTGYGIPTDNPFVGKDGLDEIYAFGLRNPYRFCLAPDGNVILADAGQEFYEEIDLVEKGGNYGWNVKEGKHCFDDANAETPPGTCPTEDEDGNPLIDPVIEFKNSKNFSDGLGNVSVGGYVYQGSISSLNDKYIFGVLAQTPDAMDGAVFAANRSGTTWNYEKLRFSNMSNNELGMLVLGFGQDKSGEVYVMTSQGAANSGKVYKIEQ
jgi:glucose/arabinose dehydrogenase